MKDTNIFIQELCRDLKSHTPAQNFRKTFWFSWGALFAATGILTIISSILFPSDIHLPHNLNDAQFWGEIALWFTLSFSSAFLTYLSCLPSEPLKKYKIATLSIAILMALAIFFRTSFTSLYLDYYNELHVSQGPCGIFVFSISALWTVVMGMIIVKAGAPTDLSLTGIALALSTGSGCALFMHFFCTHESSSHILIWHCIPLSLVVLISTKLSNKLLRW